MGGVYAKDKDTAVWSASLKSNRFYLQIFYWILDSVIHCMWVPAKQYMKDMSDENLEKSRWKWFESASEGRYKFQLTLGMQLIKAGLEMD